MAADTAVLAIGENAFPFHRFEEIGPHLADALESPRIDVTLTTDRDDLTDLREYDVLLDYLTDSTLTEAQRSSVTGFVEGGGGYLGLHCAADLTSTVSEHPDTVIESRDEPVPELRELIGGHFLTHPERSTYDVRVVDSHHPITASLSDLRVYDEPYVLEVDDSVRVLARMDHYEHADMPVVWVRDHGDGRVCYVAVGHTVSTITDPAVGDLLRRGVRWCTGDGH
ncbi:ThuA domain-containing protein [Natronobiforma cellulositropha]|uniref:ThuA domain-containing protein n=1 Tax=Natronobiforma cellulositropha TaxID=1679076 RepID=UPI0021D5E92A|nr:ThuA domain-containing protein [Natronobiforma cellulositropha]